MRRLLILLLILLMPVQASAASWSIVPGETSVEVDVPYLGNIVTLRFPGLAGRVIFDRREPSAARAEIVIRTTDVDTGNALVNAFVRGRDYLNVAQYPEIRFRLDRLVRTSESTADVFGRVTLLGVTRPVKLTAQVFRYGPTEGAPDRFDAGFAISGAVDRRAFGSTAGYPQIAAVLPVRIRLLMRSDP